ncbi:competence protein ComEC [Paenibacillus shirakamiensis]|uniref:Competence protein ComEC n=1 Tax=Paenibacillus shirakamiensis TaxID=1265935 RepID=A0ABS4JBN4_9BACL|nr:DNA internalization-related competence protein ComEC/Rec2 [Paenibacillus shirakamiensis]MBP1999130.1 competence protein ComEC [Paenibacillus shirakamiensis]
MNSRPLVYVLICWILGATLAYLVQGTEFWLWWAGVLFCLPLTGLLLRISLRKMGVGLLIFTVAALYWNYTESQNRSEISKSIQQESWTKGSIITQGIIVSAVERDGDRVEFTVQVSSLSLKGSTSLATTISGEKVAVQVKLLEQKELNKIQQWKRGGHVQLEGQWSEPAGIRNFGGFDYATYLHRHRIHNLLKVNGASQVESSEGPWSIHKILAWNDRVRVVMGQRLEKIFGTLDAGFMKGLLIGDTNDLDTEIYTGFTQLGLTHILAISGSHVAINMSILYWILRRFRVNREHAYLVILTFIPLYVLFTGFTPSVIRSGIMSMIGVYLMRQGLFKDALNVLAAAAMLMLVMEPYFLFDVSFQLSFAVTAGLIVGVPLTLPHLSALPRILRMPVAMTAVAQVISFPLSIYYFNQFSLLSVVANFLIVPIVGVLSLSGGTAALLTSLLSIKLGSWIAYPITWVNHIAFAMVNWLQSRSGFMTFWTSPSLLWIVFYYGCIGAIMSLSIKQHRESITLVDFETQPLHFKHIKGEGDHLRKTWLSRKWGVQLLLFIFLISLLYIGYRSENPSGMGRVQVLDVGQGDCILITTPTGKNILVDGGGTVTFGKPKEAWKIRKDPYEVGEKLVVPLLKKRGIHQIDALVITHGDQDHIGGLQAVLDTFPVESILMNGTRSGTATENNLMRRALEQDVPIFEVEAGMQIQPDVRTSMTFIAPTVISQDVPNSIRFEQNQNHASVAFVLEMDSYRFMFTGDMDEASEQAALDTFVLSSWTAQGNLTQNKKEADILKVDVLKVAHHGSKTSTSEKWLDRLHPSVAVISVGASNTYGHPSLPTLEKLQKEHIRIERTDQEGEVQFQTGKGGLETRHAAKMTGPSISVMVK